jgi:hypothetical protein
MPGRMCLSRNCLILVLALAVWACDKQPRQETPPTVTVDSARIVPDSARILYQTGITELAREGYDSATVAYMKARPDQFFYNEFHDFYAYNGYHFREIVRRFPTSDVADDAAYQLTKLKSQSMECEGWIPCYIHIEWGPIAEFLQAHPASVYADSAVDRALAVFGTNLDPKRSAEDEIYQYEPAEMRTILAGFDSVTRVLPPPLRTRTDSALLQWRTWVDRR